jgi:hypothetical protein
MRSCDPSQDGPQLKIGNNKNKITSQYLRSNVYERINTRTISLFEHFQQPEASVLVRR